MFGSNEATLQYVILKGFLVSVFRSIFICRLFRGNSYAICRFTVFLQFISACNYIQNYENYFICHLMLLELLHRHTQLFNYLLNKKLLLFTISDFWGRLVVHEYICRQVWIKKRLSSFSYLKLQNKTTNDHSKDG